MHIIIALFLICIICIRLLKDKGTSVLADVQYNNRRETHDSWRTKYLDHDLESKIRRYVSMPENTERVLSDIQEVLEKSDYWKRYDMSGFSLSDGKCREFALDILLAKNGKVSMSSNLIGYKAQTLFVDYEYRLRSFEYAKIIYDTLKEIDAEIELVYNWNDGNERYYWKNSSGYLMCNKKVKEFDISIINGN